MCRTQFKDLSEIQKLEFQAIDLNLFLDTHPGDKKALEEYNKTVSELAKSKKAYEAYYGPLTNFGYAESKCSWQWVQNPWPWEI